MATLIERVGGLPADPLLRQSYQQEIGQLLRTDGSRFPGAQPVSFSRAHREELKRQDYFVCEKTDGVRYLMYLTHDDQEGPCHYLIDRKNEYYYIRNLYFPHHENKNTFHRDTLLDGELVEDKYPDGRTVRKFLVFDCLVMDKKDLRDRTLDKRLGYLKEFLLKPMNKMFAEFPNRRDEMAFRVEDKKTEFSYSLDKMFHEIIPQVKQLHGNDGLIFTCKNTPYKSGTDPHILKWKPPEENTVDFLLHLEWSQMQPHPDDPDQTPQEDYDALPNASLYIYVGNRNEYAYKDRLHLTVDDWENMKNHNKPLQYSIVECYQEESSQGSRWRFHRFRDDKTDANHISTYDSVIDSISDHVTEQDLLQWADEIRTAWKLREQKARQSSLAPR